MEEKNNNTILLIVIILVIVLAGYIVYDKFIAKEKCTTVQACEEKPNELKGLAARGIDFTLSKYVHMVAGTTANIDADGEKVKMVLTSFNEDGLEVEEKDEVYYSQKFNSNVDSIKLLCNCGGCPRIYVLTEDKTLYGIDDYFHQDFSLLSNMKKYDIKDINSIGSMSDDDLEDTCGSESLYIEKTDGTIYSLNSLINK